MIWVVLGAVGWLVISVILGVLLGQGVRRADEAEGR